jgi:outer membrane protein OmpA-like peptidoglycan-associated protein
MKRFCILFLLFVAVFFSISTITACKTPPPPVEIIEPPPPPPPPPPPVVQEEVIDTSPPVLHVTLSPQPFSPDGDGVDDEMAVNNIYGEEAYFTGHVEVGILVVREGNIRRIIVPSIVFAANAGNFAGLDADTTAANDYILRRVAEALERYPDNKVKVEGHANPTTAPGTRARTDEETGTRTVKGLRPLSEERAKAVLDYLVGLGIDPERLSAVGMGSARTIVEFADRDNWWKNRRVEFILED